MSAKSMAARFARGAAPLLVVVAVLLGGCSGEQVVTPAHEAEAAPAFERPGLREERISLEAYRGKVVLLNFWATWCPFCRKEIPHLVDLQERYGAEGLQVLGAALNWKIDSRERNDPDIFHQKVAAFELEHGLNYPIPLIKEGMDEVLARFGDPVGIPYTVLIDRRGRVRKVFQGNPGPDPLEKAVRTLL
ncbi:TlpA disulfide reductase family protein [Thiohalorhabdus sp. Cl-TMA]|uniref:TlpA disulfide reductase family protein n=1 Tax=Thiohalorhabdus methylotrophus TaxID=3242694 RepID=A0ABV4TS54_9GAMM